MPLLDSHTLYTGAKERDVRTGHLLVRLSTNRAQRQAQPLACSHSYSDTVLKRVALWRVLHPKESRSVPCLSCRNW